MILEIFFVLVCLLLIFMVIITPSQEGGLASAFGGMGSESFFGTKVHRHVNRFTILLAVLFLGLAVIINQGHGGAEGNAVYKGPRDRNVDGSAQEQEQPAPAPDP